MKKSQDFYDNVYSYTSSYVRNNFDNIFVYVECGIDKKKRLRQPSLEACLGNLLARCAQAFAQKVFTILMLTLLTQITTAITKLPSQWHLNPLGCTAHRWNPCTLCFPMPMAPSRSINDQYLKSHLPFHSKWTVSIRHHIVGTSLQVMANCMLRLTKKGPFISSGCFFVC